MKNEIIINRYMVVCRDDSAQNPYGIWIKGKYKLAAGGSRGESFSSLEEAKEYMKGISSSREPFIVQVVFIDE